MTGLRWGILGLGLLVVSCKRDPGEGSREVVQEAGYEMTREALFRAAGSDDVTALKAMLEGGLSLMERDENGRTALHAAAGTGSTKSMDFFLEQGLEVDLRDKQARTPLMEAVLLSTPEAVRHLLNRGADPLKKDSENFKPLMLALRENKAVMVAELAPYVRGDLDDALLAGAILGRPAVIDELTNYGASVYARLEDGRTPLMLAAQNGRDASVDMLLAIGANRFAMDKSGRTASDLAREAGHGSLADRLAGQPVAGDFELSEPAELGAEMAVVVSQAAQEQTEEQSAANSDESAVALAGADDETAVSQVDSTGAIAPPSVAEAVSLEGVVLASTENTAASAPSAPTTDPSTGNAAAGAVVGAQIGSEVSPPVASVKPAQEKELIVMRSYREKELPLRVDSTEGKTVSLSMAGAQPVRVDEGATIPGSSLKVINITRRLSDGKDGPQEVSVVSVRDVRTGVERDLIVGLPALAHDPVALVEDVESGRYYVARTGQRFKSADGADYIVSDVRPNQVVIENMQTGETRTVMLRGPRG